MKAKEISVLQALGVRVKQLRNERTMTQQELADEADVMRYIIANIERGVANPTTTTLYAISKALQVSLSELMDFKVPKK